jgi:hypothetical protein
MNFMKYNGEGKHKAKKQEINQLIDVTLWNGNEEIEPYKEGAREKNKITCPHNAPFSFLIANHDYMFKQSNPRYPEQFWVEIIAYRLGCIMGVPVPPAFVGIDPRREIAGAVIEWFHNYPTEPREEYIPGGELFQKLIPDYDRKKGKEHNLIDLAKIVEGRKLIQNWQEVWAKIFCFDTLIGNTDRHQDNWGMLHTEEGDCFSPAFDNGTAMGHEIIERNLATKVGNLEKYVYAHRATHHMKWNRDDTHKITHLEFLKRLIEKYPDMRNYSSQCVQFSISSFKDEMYELRDLSNTLQAPYAKLTEQRTNFIIKLIEYRHQKVLEMLV